MLLGFVQNRGRVLTREQLHTFGGRREESTLRAVDTVITRLRRKLHGAKLFQIETVLHIGYRCDWASASGGNKKKARRGPVGDRRT
jgi:DNA-binding response OmpR family regulator